MRIITEREYDCLEVVRTLTEDGWSARVKDVAEGMKVKPPTALEFLDRLVRATALERGATGYRLTTKGTSVVNELTRAHRLFETLLFRAGLTPAEAHRISASVDKHVDEDAIALLCRKLNHPRKCPHQEPIPGGDRYD